MRSLEPGFSLQVRPTVGFGSPPVVTRRRLLGLSAALTLLGVAGCREQPVAAPPPLEADEVSVNRAVAAAQRLRIDALALARSQPALARLLHRVAGVHEQHLQALGAPVAPPSGSATSPPATDPAPGATDTDPPAPTAVLTSAQLIKAEAAAARAALRDGLVAAAPFAVLLCRIAAARVVNADLVSAAIDKEPPGQLRPAAAPVAPSAPSASGSAPSRTGSQGTTASDSAGSDPAGSDPAGSDPAGSDSAGSDPAGSDSAGSNPAASGPVPVRPAPGTAPSQGNRSALDLLLDTPDPFVRTPTPVATGALDPTPGRRATPPPRRPAPTATGSKGPADLNAPTTPALVALDRLLAGEHAAVFAYPLIIARTKTRLRNLAVALWRTHRNERDQLSARLLAAGIRSAVAEPAYDVGMLPTTAAKAAALAAQVEGGLAALATDLVAAGRAGDADRTFGADHLVLAARRTAQWTGTPTAFPGRNSEESPDSESR